MERGKAMRSFDVFKNNDNDVVAIKNGFSWPGFFFTFWWAFVKGLSGVGILIIVALVGAKALVVMGESNQSPGMLIFAGIMYLVIPVLVGFQGNNWLKNKLEKNGYNLGESITAKNGAEASQAFLENMPNVRVYVKEQEEEGTQCPDCLNVNTYYDYKNNLFCRDCMRITLASK
jgi:hypothetical protein